jgi:Flp pilus assembly protein CpaB
MPRVAAIDWVKGPGRRRQWRRRVLRRGLAALCAVAATLGLLGVARSSHERPLVPVVVAVRPMAVGDVASAASVREVLWPAELVPEGTAHRVTEVVGRPVVVPLGRGEPLTRAKVDAGSLLAGQPPDVVAVHVSVPDDGAVAMVSAGDRVDLAGRDGLVARGVLVLRVDQKFTTDFGSVIQGQGSSSGEALEGAGLVVAAAHDVAQAIASVPPDALGRPDLTLFLTSR